MVHREANDRIGNLIGYRQILLLGTREILVRIKVRDQGILSPARGSGFHQGALFSFVCSFILPPLTIGEFIV